MFPKVGTWQNFKGRTLSKSENDSTWQNYNFFITNDGLDRRNSMLRPEPGHQRRNSAAPRASNVELRSRRRSEPTAAGGTLTNTNRTGTGNHDHSDISEGTLRQTDDRQEASVNAPAVTANTKDKTAEDPLEGITNSMSALKFVPPSIRFGRGRGKQGLAPS